MTCTCGHPMAAHLDRIFGHSCAPDLLPTASGFMTTGPCACDGWREATGEGE